MRPGTSPLTVCRAPGQKSGPESRARGGGVFAGSARVPRVRPSPQDPPARRSTPTSRPRTCKPTGHRWRVRSGAAAAPARCLVDACIAGGPRVRRQATRQGRAAPHTPPTRGWLQHPHQGLLQQTQAGLSTVLVSVWAWRRAGCSRTGAGVPPAPRAQSQAVDCAPDRVAQRVAFFATRLFQCFWPEP